jgi:hypothetical protein
MNTMTLKERETARDNSDEDDKDLTGLTDRELAIYLEEGEDPSVLEEDHGQVRRARMHRNNYRLQRVHKELFRRALDPETGRRIPIQNIGGTPIPADLRKPRKGQGPSQASIGGEQGEDAAEETAQERAKAGDEARTGELGQEERTIRRLFGDAPFDLFKSKRRNWY